jgi:hypothetical protein
VPEEIDNLFKSGVFGQCMDVKTLVAQDASLAINETNA